MRNRKKLKERNRKKLKDKNWKKLKENQKESEIDGKNY